MRLDHLLSKENSADDSLLQCPRSVMVERKVVTLFNLEGARWRGGEPYGPMRRYSLGGDSRDRTGDLLLARQALSQLSYIPVLSVVPPAGVYPLN